MDIDISHDTVQPRLVARVHREGDMAEIPQLIGEAFTTILQTLSDAEVAPAGPVMVIYDGPMLPEQPISFTPAIPVDKDFTCETEVVLHEVPGGEVMVGTMTGPYTELATAWNLLQEATTEAGYRLDGAPREIYLNDPADTAPADLSTRIEFPVTKMKV